MNEQIKTADGRIYNVNDAGTRIRVYPARPWHGKAERKAVIKARREAAKGGVK